MTIEALLDARYYRGDEQTWKELAARVIDSLYYDRESYLGSEGQKAREAMSLLENKLFIPSSPVLMSAGSERPMMCSCFVYPVKDSIKDIMKSLTDTVMTQKYGGGVGIDFSPIRAEGSLVSTTGGQASGPVSFAGFWNEAMNVIRQGGKRQGAMMGVLNWQHPDIKRFIRAKAEEGELTNFNLSVGLDAEFFSKLKAGDERAHELFCMISDYAWRNGEPGVLFLDNINRNNKFGIPITATNPCGEVPLPPYGACCLGSINLSKMTRHYRSKKIVDWLKVGRAARVGAEFLNRVLLNSWWPTPETEEFALDKRPIGLGVMGFADMLASLHIPYGSEECMDIIDMLFDVMGRRVRPIADLYENTTMFSIAPTGSIAMLAGCSYSIEPYFSLAGQKEVEAGSFSYSNRMLAHTSEEMGYELTDEDWGIIRETGSLTETEVPDEVKEVFRTANEIPPETHLAVQARVQKYVDNAVSKTVNLPASTTPADIRKLMLSAHKQGIKGFTVYRNHSREDEVFQSCPSGKCDI